MNHSHKSIIVHVLVYGTDCQDILDFLDEQD